MRIIDNFWNNKRKEFDLSIGDVAKIMNVGKSTASSYLAGICMPSKDKIFALCAYCNVDVATGTHEFSKAYNTWEKHHPGYVRNGNSYTKIKKEPVVEAPLYVPELEAEPTPKKHAKKGGDTRKLDTINNFWTQKKLEKGVSFSDISKAIDIPATSVRNFFVGRMVPADETVAKLCAYMDVDYQTGLDEFKTIAAGCEVSRRRRRSRKTAVAVAPAAEVKAKAKTKAKIKTRVKAKPEAKVATKEIPAYLEKLYGKLAFKDFMDICLNTKTREDVLHLLYGNVDYDTFCQVVDSL